MRVQTGLGIKNVKVASQC